MKEQRRLAAIMFTDIVGYSALMSKDEKHTMSILLKNRTIHKTTIRKFNGEFIKEIGDGTLSIFQSSWDAVACAIDIQNSMNGDDSFQLRIGIHIGDIVISENDVFGEGVNIASRIQSLCEPGGVCISERVYEDIKNKTGIEAECLGEKMLKNIDLPVNIYLIGSECARVLMEHQSSVKETISLLRKILQKLSYANSSKKAHIFITLSSAIIVLLLLIYVFILEKPGLNEPISDKKVSINKDGEFSWKSSVAVMPFTDLSPEKDQEYFCDGIAEELINVMTTIHELKVVARTSAFSFKGKDEDIRNIGKKLNVKTILEGSVRKSGNQLRISVQLIEVKNGYHIWSHVYDQEMKDVFDIQKEIASAIVTTLKAKLLPEEQKQLEKKQYKNSEAFQLYLKGRFHWNKRTEADLNRAIGYFNQAIELDPGYAMAFAGLASTYVILPEHSGLMQNEFYQKAMFYAEKASELDPSIAEPYAVTGMIKYANEFEWDSAEDEFKRAINLNPNYPTAHHWYSMYLRYQGRFAESLAECRISLELDPLSPILNTNLGWTLYSMQEYDLAKDQFQKTIALNPDFPMPYYGLAAIKLTHDQFNEAIAEFRKGEKYDLGDSINLAINGYIFAKTGRDSEAMKALDKLMVYSEQGYSASMGIALIYIGLGDKDRAFEWLWKAYDDREAKLVELKIDPTWNNLHSDPRFNELLKKIGL